MRGISSIMRLALTVSIVLLALLCLLSALIVATFGQQSPPLTSVMSILVSIAMAGGYMLIISILYGKHLQKWLDYSSAGFILVSYGLGALELFFDPNIRGSDYTWLSPQSLHGLWVMITGLVLFVYWMLTRTQTAPVPK